jgi:hypothetical protein
VPRSTSLSQPFAVVLGHIGMIALALGGFYFPVIQQMTVLSTITVAPVSSVHCTAIPLGGQSVGKGLM